MVLAGTDSNQILPLPQRQRVDRVEVDCPGPELAKAARSCNASRGRSWRPTLTLAGRCECPKPATRRPVVGIKPSGKPTSS